MIELDDSVAYSLIVFSPMLFLHLWLNIRYDAVYISLRSKHSKTYLKKNKGTLCDMLFFKKYKDQLDRRLYVLHGCLLWIVIISILLAAVYGVLWLVGHHIQHKWLPWLYVEFDIGVTGLFILKLIYDKVMHK